MKSLIQAVAIVVVLATPVMSFAKQPNTPITRARVLGELEKAGYHPAPSRDPYHPADIQAAEARVAAQNVNSATARASIADTSGVGGVVSGTSASGAPAAVRTAADGGMKQIYRGH
ncbi:hypothetical protein AYM40_07355 [Paraburkholderia phytofirmans OLGA172]|uniref:Purine-nucleoside phosphorylase n=1 Tax=Paraburkholderia phytofirmans OLGA172 TaxID=1417228 RepID=A0A160FIW7_9BURK|nr:DUF4148 domain-containing protein [Paraburkholderia phytofirmans]ANB72201.1 hypothetical protein AYM40_07355 [Paraburkholderia phytofirmans OLGA172]